MLCFGFVRAGYGGQLRRRWRESWRYLSLREALMKHKIEKNTVQETLIIPPCLPGRYVQAASKPYRRNIYPPD